MKILSNILCLALLISSCQKKDCNCSEEISIQQLDSLANRFSFLYDDYWEAYGEHKIKGQKEDIIRLESNFFLVPFRKVYTIKKIDKSYILTTKKVKSNHVFKQPPVYELISENRIILTQEDWDEINKSITENCFWSKPSSIGEYADGIPFSIEVNQIKPNECTNRNYHIIQSAYRDSITNDLNNIFDVITKHESIEDLVILNKEYFKQLKSK